MFNNCSAKCIQCKIDLERVKSEEEGTSEDDEQKVWNRVLLNLRSKKTYIYQMY